MVVPFEDADIDKGLFKKGQKLGERLLFSLFELLKEIYNTIYDIEIAIQFVEIINNYLKIAILFILIDKDGDVLLNGIF